MKIMFVFGTRPEAIKLAPIIREFRHRSDSVADLRICATAQHRDMLDQVLKVFDIKPDYDLDLMRATQTPLHVASKILTELERIWEHDRPDWVVVQGDTTTVLAAALAAFYNRIKVAHVEAGLRTNNKLHPFPEEVNRRLTSVVADLHFAPTEHARQNLIMEQIPVDDIIITGNTVIDALYWAVNQPLQHTGHIGGVFSREQWADIFENPDKPFILVTAHRRENFGEPLQQIAAALKEIASKFAHDVRLVYSVHPNPNVWEPVHNALHDVPNIILVPPLDYHTLVHVMKRAKLVITDSGGIQEEAPSLGIPVLVLRKTTERPEAVEAGTVRIVGTDHKTIVDETTRLLKDVQAYMSMARAVNPYGDGKAALRIADKLLGLPTEEFSSKFHK